MCTQPDDMEEYWKQFCGECGEPLNEDGKCDSCGNMQNAD